MDQDYTDEQVLQLVATAVTGGDGDAPVKAILDLALSNFSIETAAAVRTAGHLTGLVQLLDSHSVDVCTAAATTLCKIAEADRPYSMTALLQANVGAKVRRLLDITHPETAEAGLRLMNKCLQSDDADLVQQATRDLAVGGYLLKLLSLLSADHDKQTVSEAAAWTLVNMADMSPWVRHELRKYGILPIVVPLVQRHPDSIPYLAALYNLSRSEALHVALQEQHLLDVLVHVVMHTNLEVNRVVATMTGAHVYASQEAQGGCDRMVREGEPPVPVSMLQMLESSLKGHPFGGVHWSVDEAVHGILSLTSNRGYVTVLAEGGVGEMLGSLLVPGSDAGPDVQTKALRALLNMMSVEGALRRLSHQGIVEAVRAHQNAEDVKMADAARGCLLLLGELGDKAAEDALAASKDTSGTAQYDAVICYHAGDAAVLARRLHNMLILRGVRTFLDEEHRSPDTTGRNLILLLSDHVFDESRSLHQLAAAAEHGAGVVLVVKEGSRFPDSTTGRRTAEFPPRDLVETLPEPIQQAFTEKALHHSDDWYQEFAEALIARLAKRPKTPRKNGRTDSSTTVKTDSANGGRIELTASSVDDRTEVAAGAKGRAGANSRSNGRTDVVVNRRPDSGFSSGSFQPLESEHGSVNGDVVQLSDLDAAAEAAAAAAAAVPQPPPSSGSYDDANGGDVPRQRSELEDRRYNPAHGSENIRNFHYEAPAARQAVGSSNNPSHITPQNSEGPTERSAPSSPAKSRSASQGYDAPLARDSTGRQENGYLEGGSRADIKAYGSAHSLREEERTRADTPNSTSSSHAPWPMAYDPLPQGWHVDAQRAVSAGPQPVGAYPPVAMMAPGGVAAAQPPMALLVPYYQPGPVPGTNGQLNTAIQELQADVKQLRAEGSISHADLRTILHSQQALRAELGQVRSDVALLLKGFSDLHSMVQDAVRALHNAAAPAPAPAPRARSPRATTAPEQSRRPSSPRSQDPQGAQPQELGPAPYQMDMAATIPGGSRQQRFSNSGVTALTPTNAPPGPFPLIPAGLVTRWASPIRSTMPESRNSPPSPSRQPSARPPKPMYFSMGR